MTTLRNRMVTEQDGRQHVSPSLLTLDEAADMLDLETQLHKATGWTVSRYGPCLRCEKGPVIRWVWVRSKPPLEDTL